MNDRRILKAILTSSMLPVAPENLSPRYQRLLSARDHVAANRDNEQTGDAISDIMAVLADEFATIPTTAEKAIAQELVARVLLDRDYMNEWTDAQVRILEDLTVNVAVIRALIRNYGVALTDDALLPWVMRYRDYLVNI